MKTSNPYRFLPWPVNFSLQQTLCGLFLEDKDIAKHRLSAPGGITADQKAHQPGGVCAIGIAGGHQLFVDVETKIGAGCNHQEGIGPVVAGLDGGGARPVDERNPGGGIASGGQDKAIGTLGVDLQGIKPLGAGTQTEDQSI